MTSEVEERPRVVMALCGGLGVNGLTKKAKNPDFAEFLAFWGLFGIGFANLAQKDPSFGKLAHVINKESQKSRFCRISGVLGLVWDRFRKFSTKGPIFRKIGQLT